MIADPPFAASSGIAAALSALPARCPMHALTADIRAAAIRALVDTVGVTMAGRGEPAVGRLLTTLAEGDEALSLAAGRRLRTEDAALVDGFAAHMLDYDDVAAHGHPSVVIVPALLAEAQRLGAAGPALLAAYAVGYEAWAMISACEPDAYHLASWHPTPMIGILAATIALAALAGLDAATTRNALGLAASFASGVIANFGTPAKPLQAGRAAAGAVQAVRLARAGLTASSDAVDGRHGLLRGISPRGRATMDTPMAPSPGIWRLREEGLSVKRYPVCYAAHRAIDGVLALIRDTGLAPADVRAVTVSLAAAPAATLRYHHPRDGAEARFSLHHNVAAALLDRAVGFAQLTDRYVRRPDVVALFALTRLEIVGGELCPDQPGLAKFDRVCIETRDGCRLDSGPIRYPRGHARLPLDDDELDAKFLDCARHGDVAMPGRLLQRVRGLDTVVNMREAGLW